MQSLHDFLKTLSHNHLFIPIKYVFGSSSQTCHKTCRYISTRKYHQTFTIWALYTFIVMIIKWWWLFGVSWELSKWNSCFFLFTATQTHNISLKCGQRKHWLYFWGHFSTSLKYLRKKRQTRKYNINKDNVRFCFFVRNPLVQPAESTCNKS